MMTLSIVTHRQGPLLAALLADIARLDSALVSAIVITRNVDEDRIAIPAALEPMTKVIDNEAPKGFGANHDAAFAHCATPLFVVMNPDIRIAADPFAAIAARFDLTASGAAAIALISPRITAPDGRDEDAARELITPWRLIRRRLMNRDRKAIEHFDWLAGMFLVLRSDAFRKVGGFDTRYFMYCEDFDLCARLRLAGWGLVRATDVSVIHDARRASLRSRQHLAWHVTSLLRMWTSSAFWRYRRMLMAERG